jgi:hypothetical protein
MVSRRALLRLGLVLSATGLTPLAPPAPVLETSEVVHTRSYRIDHDPGPADGATYCSPVFDLARYASSVGLHWVQDRSDGARPSLSLRTSVDDRTWGAWQEVEGEGGSREGERLRVFGTLASVGRARYAQYRIAWQGNAVGIPVHRVSLFGIDSAEAPRRTVTRLLWAPAHEAAAAIKPLGIVSRQQWGANEGLRYGSEPGKVEEIWPEEVTKVEKIVVHHTAGPNVCATGDLTCQRRSVDAINDIYYYHSVVNGWGDIGYNSLIGYDGRIYEGRHGPEPQGGEPLSEAVVGGHALRYNNRTFGISVMGNFDLEPVPDHQFDALQRLIGWIVRSKLTVTGGIDPLGRSDYQLASGEVHRALPNVIGHRDVFDTECPGEFMYRRIEELKVHVKRLTEWPPVGVTLRARPSGNGTVTYHVLVDNHEPELVRGMTVRGAIPTNAEYVDSWAGTPGSNRGGWDGSTVAWIDPEAKLDPGRDRREYVFVLRPKPGVPRAQVEAVAWAEFSEPARGVAMSEQVSAAQPADLVVAGVVGRGAGFLGAWRESREVGGYYGDAYFLHEPGDGRSYFRWLVDLPDPGPYDVLAWWPPADGLATNAPFHLSARGGERVVRVVQRERGALWGRVGRFAFDAGRAEVRLTDDADGPVVANAIRFRQAPGA